jgi:hypothetical protein
MDVQTNSPRDFDTGAGYTLEIAKRTGYKLALQGTIVTELIIIFLLSSFILSSTRSTQAITQLVETIGLLNICSFILLTLIFASVLGRRAGVIFMEQNSHRFLASYKAGFLIVLCSTVSSSLFALLIDSITGTVSSDWFFFYLTKPVVWLTVCSAVPIFITGTWYAVQFVNKTKTARK